jgi:NTE family protein
VSPPSTGLVLSGGGARGAYEVGVVSGIVEVLGLRPDDPAPFQVFAGTSVGAINATYLAGHVHQGDLNVAGLRQVWHDLHLQTHLRVDPLRLMGLRSRWARFLRDDPRRFGPSLLDPGPLDAVVTEAVPWRRLREHTQSGLLQGLVVAALHIATGRTTMFAQVAPDRVFAPSKDPRRRAVRTEIGIPHVLASAAIPAVFPARRVEGAWYCDGGLRFNTPIAPAIRAGADRLVVVSLMHPHGPDHDVQLDEYPNPIFLMGKVLNALLLDPVNYDLQVLDRFNRLVEVLESSLEPHELKKVEDVTRRDRGMPYRRLETLVFRPSRDLGQMASEHLARESVRQEMGWVGSWLLRRAARHDATWEDDLASYVLFDGGFADELIALGHADALAKAELIRAFWGG